MKNTLLTFYIVFLVIAAGFGVGAATNAGILIPAAVPFATVSFRTMLIKCTRWLVSTVGRLEESLAGV